MFEGLTLCVVSQTIELNPVTRIEGHLSVKVDIQDGKVASAFVAGEMFRGFERILVGRDPLDAQHITQRICGVCPVEHGVASVLAQEMAYQLTPPPNGVLARNLIQAANFIMSHISHFYLLSGVDFVDVAMIADYKGSDPALAALQGWVKAQQASHAILPAAPFLPRYAAKYLQEADTNFLALRHYLDALDMRALAHRMGAIFAGKLPHAATLVPGGITEKVTALKICEYRSALDTLRWFIDNAYLPDVAAVAKAFPEYFSMGKGCGNFLAYGVFPDATDSGAKLLPGGVLLDGKLQPVDEKAITEDVARSRYSSASGLRPADGETVAAPDKSGAYSWLKAPRYNGRVMEVGALARVLVAYHDGRNVAIRRVVEALLKQLGREPGDLNSVLGRHAARALECKFIADQCAQWLDQMTPDGVAFADFSVPESGRGYGLTEAARGALGHWLEIGGSKIRNYQCVVPTTWNCSPRDDRDVPGAMEQALGGLTVADAANPIEAARVIRSFDPCLACAVH
jgi:ferredoxin hydrogenase large subunit/hydrogenase large subunit